MQSRTNTQSLLTLNYFEHFLIHLYNCIIQTTFTIPGKSARKWYVRWGQQLVMVRTLPPEHAFTIIVCFRLSCNKIRWLDVSNDNELATVEMGYVWLKHRHSYCLRILTQPNFAFVIYTVPLFFNSFIKPVGFYFDMTDPNKDIGNTLLSIYVVGYIYIYCIL